MGTIIAIFAAIGSGIVNTALVLTTTAAVALLASAMFCMLSAATRMGNPSNSAGIGFWVGLLAGFVWPIVALSNTTYGGALTSVIGLLAALAVVTIIAWRVDENRNYGGRPDDYNPARRRGF